MKTLKNILKKFDEEFCFDEKDDWYNGQGEDFRDFISSQIKELLEELVPEEKEQTGGDEEAGGWNMCIDELQEKIKKILE